jgi:hypothetical protein
VTKRIILNYLGASTKSYRGGVINWKLERKTLKMKFNLMVAGLGSGRRRVVTKSAVIIYKNFARRS